MLLYAIATNGNFLEESTFCASLLKLYLPRFGLVLHGRAEVLRDAASRSIEEYARKAMQFRTSPQFDWLGNARRGRRGSLSQSRPAPVDRNDMLDRLTVWTVRATVNP